ncbi:MAG TPA: hypothetical protein V6D29_15965 [Leptolyngbyaceae cyanobacterium]
MGIAIAQSLTSQFTVSSTQGRRSATRNPRSTQLERGDHTPDLFSRFRSCTRCSALGISESSAFKVLETKTVSCDTDEGYLGRPL